VATSDGALFMRLCRPPSPSPYRAGEQFLEDLLYSDDYAKCGTASVHDRMPVILDPDPYDLWLDPTSTNVNVISELLAPYDARLMRRYPVNTRINHLENDDSHQRGAQPQVPRR
jgi:hypothetical protein